MFLHTGISIGYGEYQNIHSTVHLESNSASPALLLGRLDFERLISQLTCDEAPNRDLITVPGRLILQSQFICCPCSEGGHGWTCLIDGLGKLSVRGNCVPGL